MEKNLLVGRGKPTHPGELIRRVLLRNYRLTIDDVANKAEMDLSELQKVIAGQSDVTQSVRNHLYPLFGKAADRLLHLQLVYNFYKKVGRTPTQAERRRLDAPSPKQRM